MAKDFWMGNEPAQSYFNANINEFFSFRIQSINWQINSAERPISDWQFLTDKQNVNDSSRALLSDNLLFALRVSHRALSDMAEPSSNPVPGPAAHAPGKLPGISFQEFIGLVSLSVPDSLLQSVVDLFRASLRIEFALNMTYILHRENLNPESTKIEDLATFTAEAGQDFGAIAREIKPKQTRRQHHSPELSPDVLEENQLLAELDLQTLADP